MLYLSNAFSIQMLPVVPETGAIVKVEQVTPEEVSNELKSHEFVNAVGHEDTAAVVSNMIGINISKSRVDVFIQPEDVLYVAQVLGGRLPEGATQLPAGMEIKFYKVTLV